MPAHSENFPWMSYYGNYHFFEQRMDEHTRVESFERVNPSVYHIKLTNGRRIKTFVCECYSFDVAEYIESCENYGPLDAVVINSNWCGYTPDVKRYCMNEQVGVYDISGFMAAINRIDYWNYLTRREREHFHANGWI
ncbi:hypothetical protein ACQ2HG_20680 [Aeromonas hydrophila]|uniref:hypothetical protein n=1 Tax=Aeromonas hydrophila TaxID=644 RepID=UPI001F52CDD7|nr:hypothetical protein [Aeromonas hydrophila]UUT61608.1 hypothetical protein MOO40_09215 [Aeromonas hydrophila]